MAVPTISFRDGNGVIKYVNGHKSVDNAFTFNSSPDTNISTFSYQIYVPITTNANAIALIQGSATKTVRIREIKINGAADTAIITNIGVYRASNSGTSGSATVTAITAMAHDTSNSATAVVSKVAGVMSTAPTVVAYSNGDWLFVADAGAAVDGYSPLTYKYGDDGSQAFVLRGTGQYAVISNELANTANNQSYYITITTTEEAE